MTMRGAALARGLVMSALTVSLFGIGLSSRTTAQAATINCSVASSELPADTEEQNLFNLINSFRTRPYTWSTTLSGAAIWMAHDMATHNYKGHIDSLNRDVRTRLTDCGYSPTAPVGEDITAGMTYMFGDMATLSDWMFNSADWNLIVGTQYTTIGIGRAYGPYSTEKWYWVVVVGTDGNTLAGPTATPAAPTATRTATAVPPTATSVPPTATAVPPTATAVPPTATATKVPATATATAVPPTTTSVPPTATATTVPPTATASVTPTTTFWDPTPTPTKKSNGRGNGRVSK
jgi:uncharacterized protein YkwD